MAVSFAQIDGCVSDAHGTLFNLDSALFGAMTDRGDPPRRVAKTWRSKQIEYAQLRSMMGRYTDFEQVTREALRMP